MGDGVTQFEPTDLQAALLNAFVETDYRIGIGAACQQAGVSRQRYYIWMKNPGFARWWTAQAEEHFAKTLPQVHAALLASAEGQDVGGNSADRRTFLERFDKGFVPRSRQDTKDLTGEDAHPGDYDKLCREFAQELSEEALSERPSAAEVDRGAQQG